jgi:hypothetical protein
MQQMVSGSPRLCEASRPQLSRTVLQGRASRGTGSSLTTWSWCQTANGRLCACTCKRTLHAASLRTEGGGGQIDIDAPIPTHMTQIPLLIQRDQPGIWVNPRLRGRVRWARWETPHEEGHSHRSVALRGRSLVECGRSASVTSRPS